MIAIALGVLLGLAVSGSLRGFANARIEDFDEADETDQSVEDAAQESR